MPELVIIMTIMGIQEYESNISNYLFNKTARSLMSLLYGRPDEEFYINQLMKATGSGSGAIQRELKRMTEAGLVIREKKGNQVYYQANSKSPIFNELKSIVRKTFGVADVLWEALAPFSKNIKAAFIFGSIARNSDDRKSDIDVMVIGDITFGDVVSALSPAESALGREINSVVYPIAEFRQKAGSGHNFVKNVLENDKIFLIGDEDELARLGK
jgi:predicted nucleotidyltransferase